MTLFNVSELRKLYTDYGTVYLGKIEETLGKCGNDVKLKIDHGIQMSYAVPSIMRKTNLFDSSYLDSSAVDGLFHDIGRFRQYELTGNLRDYDLEQKEGIKDHGRLGEILLQDEAFYRSFFSNNTEYAEVLKSVVGNHTFIYQPQYQCDFSQFPSIFCDYSLEEILKSNREEWKNLLIGAKIQLIQEADNFELIQNIINHNWTPRISSLKEDWITEEGWKLFINNQPMIMTELKKKNSWTCNTGVALRYGLLTRKIQLRSTLEEILEKDYLRKVYERTIATATDDYGNKMESTDPLIQESYLYITELVKNLIAMSDLIITEESRKAAVEKTKKMF